MMTDLSMDSIVRLLSAPEKTISFAILSGTVGFLGKAIYDLWAVRRKERLERVNQQLKLLYGPLYALNEAGYHAWLAFRSRVRPDGSFFGRVPPPTNAEVEAWRIWMTAVFRPNQETMLDIITRNSDLFIESDLPKPLQLFCAHVAAYKAVFARWEKGDFSENTSVLNYPTDEMRQYLEQSYKRLKCEQGQLLGR